MICSICLYTGNAEGKTEEETKADTVINGQAVCLDHVGYVASGAHSRALAAVAEQAGFSSLSAMQDSRRSPEQPQ